MKVKAVSYITQHSKQCPAVADKPGATQNHAKNCSSLKLKQVPDKLKLTTCLK